MTAVPSLFAERQALHDANYRSGVMNRRHDSNGPSFALDRSSAYRTICLAPHPEFRRVLKGARDFISAA